MCWFCRTTTQIFPLWRYHNISNSHFMTSKPGKQTITTHILPNITWSKSNQTMKFGQSIECNKRNIFYKKLCRKWGRETGCRPLFIFLKSFIWGKNELSAYFQYILVALFQFVIFNPWRVPWSWKPFIQSKI